MKTIFDFSVTDIEMDDLLGQPMSSDEYVTLRTNPDEVLGDIYCLLAYRGKTVEAEEILNQISDKNYATSLKESF